MELMKQRIKSEIWKIRKQKTPNQNSKKKKESKKNEDSIRCFWDNFKCTYIPYHGGDKRTKNESKKLKICMKQ